jgi:hypothetical protein
MNPPPPREELAGCIWLPRLVAKARLNQTGKLEPEYASRFGHPTGVDGQFLGFFALQKEDILAVCGLNDGQIATWFASLPSASPLRIQEWNYIAANLGRAGFPMSERLQVALATTYKHLGQRKFETIFEMLEADEKG